MIEIVCQPVSTATMQVMARSVFVISRCLLVLTAYDSRVERDLHGIIGRGVGRTRYASRISSGINQLTIWWPRCDALGAREDTIHAQTPPR